MGVSKDRIHRFSFHVVLVRLLVAFLIAGMIALAPAFAAEKASLPKSVNIGSNPSGSLFYAIASGVAATISAHAPFKAEPAPYSGSSTFLPLLIDVVKYGVPSVVHPKVRIISVLRVS